MSVQSIGIHKISHPITITTKSGASQKTIANLDIALSHSSVSGKSCMAMLFPLLAKYTENMQPKNISELLLKMTGIVDAADIRLQISFPYFVDKIAPVSGTRSLMDYQCTVIGQTSTDSPPLISVCVPVTTLCPCSKEISEGGAHNQRAEITLTLQSELPIWLEDLIALVEACGSSQLFSLLKRPDEKYVTEKAYENPLFVEDVARMVALRAKQLEGTQWFSVSVESFESIHNHSAYAYIDSSDLHC
ncbi:MAG: GTP cyclohydrolase I FolE2 [Desulfobulbus propionicus]|nr:MAG: GTP cyclohydrolase I FolE2 [Desulfobulbus propionicus]PIE66583.1 MAG: GTP cyclohydrolase I FolE2 [Desulfobacterales bacterium]